MPSLTSSSHSANRPGNPSHLHLQVALAHEVTRTKEIGLVASAVPWRSRRWTSASVTRG